MVEQMGAVQCTDLAEFLRAFAEVAYCFMQYRDPVFVDGIPNNMLPRGVLRINEKGLVLVQCWEQRWVVFNDPHVAFGYIPQRVRRNEEVPDSPGPWRTKYPGWANAAVIRRG